MKRITICTILIFLLGFILLINEARSDTYLNLTGKWSEIINSEDLQDGAGSDFNESFESSSDKVTMDILGIAGASDPWQVDIKKVDIKWSDDFHFSIKMTSVGIGDGSIIGGLLYQEITDDNQYFFSGSGNRVGINFQQKLTGVSATNLAGKYSITIMYTFVGL
jgi:hypothetical protein